MPKETPFPQKSHFAITQHLHYRKKYDVHIRPDIHYSNKNQKNQALFLIFFDFLHFFEIQPPCKTGFRHRTVIGPIRADHAVALAFFFIRKQQADGAHTGQIFVRKI